MTERELKQAAIDEAEELLIVASEDGYWSENVLFSRAENGTVVATVYDRLGSEKGIVTLTLTAEWGERL